MLVPNRHFDQFQTKLIMIFLSELLRARLDPRYITSDCLGKTIPFLQVLGDFRDVPGLTHSS